MHEVAEAGANKFPREVGLSACLEPGRGSCFGTARANKAAALRPSGALRAYWLRDAPRRRRCRRRRRQPPSWGLKCCRARQPCFRRLQRHVRRGRFPRICRRPRVVTERRGGRSERLLMCHAAIRASQADGPVTGTGPNRHSSAPSEHRPICTRSTGAGRHRRAEVLEFLATRRTGIAASVRRCRMRRRMRHAAEASPNRQQDLDRWNELARGPLGEFGRDKGPVSARLGRGGTESRSSKVSRQLTRKSLTSGASPQSDYRAGPSPP
jgi:hypothetical protein